MDAGGDPGSAPRQQAAAVAQLLQFPADFMAHQPMMLATEGFLHPAFGIQLQVRFNALPLSKTS